MKKHVFIIFLLNILAFTGFSQPLPCPPSNTTSVTASNTGAACSGACTKVYSTHTTSLKSTSSYTLTDIPYLPTAFTGGTPILVGIDDVYSAALTLPFEFCFYGTKYNQCLIGANGQICFDLTLAGAYNPWAITAPIPAGNNTATLNCIMGAYYDLDPSIYGNITYATYGTAPCRTFVVSWNNVALFNTPSCPGLAGTQQIVLYESTYAIDIFIQSRPLCTAWNSGFGTVGIENAAGTSFMLYPGYNGTAWSATNFACRFTPDGPATWTFTWTDPAGTVVGTGDSATVCPLVATAYTVRGVASSNCDSIVVNSTTTVLVGPSPAITGVTVNPPSFCGATDGSFTLQGLTAGSIDTLFYTYNGVPQAPTVYVVPAGGTITVSGLAAGSVTNMYVKVGPCISNIVTATIPQPLPPLVTVDSAVVKTCVGVPVQLHSYVNPALPTGFAYTYTWAPPTDLSATNIANPLVTPAVAGNVTYTVTVNPTPAIPACAATANVTVHTIGDFVVNNPFNTICLLNPLTGVTANVTGSSEINYAWTPVTGVVTATSMTPVITPTNSGTFVYTVTGSYANCPDYVHTLTIVVDTPGSGLYVRDTICLGMSDVVDMSSTGGPGYHYLWTSSPAGVTFVNDTLPNTPFTPTAVGVYTLTTLVTSPSNASGCGIRDTVILLVLPNVLTISPVDTAICAGQVVQVTGNILYSNIFTYQWLPTTGIASPNVLNVLIATDTSDVYTVTASFHRCPDIYATLNLDVQPNPSVYIGGNRQFCQFDTLHLHASVTPAWYSGYNYLWSPAGNLDNTTGANVVFTNDSSTMVYVTVTTSAGCTAKDSAYFTLSPGNFASTIANSDFCPHDSRVIPIVPAGYSYAWHPPLYVSDSTSSAPTISPITTQTYSIVGTSPDGCKDTVYWTATVYPDAVIEVGDSLTLFPGESYHIVPGTNCTSFSWFPYSGLSNPLISDPVATPDVSTMYVVTAITEHNCVTRDTLNIFVAEESLLAMPNAFTPGTGPNNTFKVILRGIASLNYFRVYNRWGNLLFETKNLSEGWDGAYKGEPQEMGVYIYDVQAVSSTGKRFNKRGNVTLLR